MCANGTSAQVPEGRERSDTGELEGRFIEG